MYPWWLDTGADIGGQTGSGVDSGNFDYNAPSPSYGGGYNSWAQDDAIDAGGSYGGPTGSGVDSGNFDYGGDFTYGGDFNYGGYNPSFTMGAGSSGAGQNVPGSFGNATAGSGNFGGATMGAGVGGGTFTSPAVQGNAGVAGGMGVDPNTWRQGDDIDRGSTLENSLNTAKNVAGNAATSVGAGLSRVGEYAQKNPWAARLAVDAAGLGLGYLNQRNANKLAQEQLQMQRDAQSRNDERARFWNEQSTQSANEARSLYNPQEMGVRAMATQTGNAQTAMDTAAQQMRRRGMSQATIDAEMRRARIGGSTGAATAYTRGLDTGRVAQQSALSSAKGLGMDSNFTPSYGGAEAASKAGDMTTKQLQNLLNTYLRNPVGRTNAQIIDDQQRETGQ
jgi:hypothetical protein